MTSINKRYKVNQNIKVPQLRVITGEGENLGILKTSEALKEAQERDLDLILLVENANPPVAKILDFNKFLYEERKKASATKAKSKKSGLKEFRFGPTIGNSDLNVRISRAREFLEDNNKVKVTVKLRGRETMHPEIGYEKINKFISELGDVARVEEEPKLVANMISVTFVGK